MKFDFGIIGSGPAGYTSALSASSAGKKVVLFEKDFIGGVCLNKGCIPTKTMLHSAEIFESVAKSAEFGVCVDSCELDFTKIVERRKFVVEKLRAGLERSFISAGVKIVNFEAEIIDKNTIKANNEIYTCKEIIVATGAVPRQIKGMEFDGKHILSSDDILSLEKLPKNIIVIGSGAVGIEFTRILSAFNVNVTLIEMAQNLLPNADIEVSKRIERIFKAKDLKFYTNTSVEKINKSENGIEAILSNGDVINAECALVAIGRVADNIKKIEGITYLGDVSGEIQLAHFASKQALEKIVQIPFDKTLVPFVVYGKPEIAWIGKREQDLENDTYEKSMLPISALAKSHCDNATEGMIKILVQNDKIVGAHIISSEASSLIQQLVIAMQTDTSIDKLKSVCFAHPTYSEGIFDCLMRLK